MSAGRSTLLVGAVALVYSAVLVALVQSAPPPAGAPGALGAPAPAAPPPAGARLEHPPIRAAHYFGREWAMNVWNSDLSSVDADFRRLRSDGFDTVALVVPWAEFQPGMAPVRWDARPWARLRRVLRAAERHKLGVVARVGYTWDFVADADGAYGQRFTQLYGSEAPLHAWEAYTARLNQELSRSPAFRFAYLTWEDFWGPVFAAEEARTRAQRVRLARETGFTRWVRRRASLARLSRLYGEPLERWGDVGVPPRDAPGYGLFLEFVDETLVSRIYGRAHRQLPKLSLEARIDRERVVLRAGGDAFRYYHHARQFRLPGAPFVTTYFAPAIGARNERDTDRAIAVLARMDALLGRAVVDAGGRPVFLDQFVYFDDSPKYAQLTQVRPAELGALIRCAAPLIARHTRGYGVWAYRDFRQNGVYNPSFELGLSGWRARGAGTLRRSGHGHVAAVRAGGTLAQQMAPSQHPEWPSSRRVIVELRARATHRAGSIGIGVAGARGTSAVGSAWRFMRLSLPRRGAPPFRLLLRPTTDVELDDVRVYVHVARGRVRRLDGSASDELPAVRALNAALASGRAGSDSYGACLRRAGRS